MITGAHAVLFTTDADADRGFFRDVLKFPSVDVGGGWLIFGLPPAELAAHPADENGRHELYLMCDDINATVAELSARGADIPGPVTDEGFGLVTAIRLPGGSELGLYQPETRHRSPKKLLGAVVARLLGRKAQPSQARGRWRMEPSARL